MHFWRRIPRFCAILYSLWANFVLGGPTWSMYQYNDMDALFIQAKKYGPTTYYDWLGNVCDGILITDADQIAARNDFPTNIRGTILEVEEQPPELEKYKSTIVRYELVVPKLDKFIVVDLANCGADSTNKYYITNGYEKYSLFFLFVLNTSTQLISLRAIVQEDIKPRIEDAKAIETSYFLRAHLDLQILIEAHPRRTRVKKQEDPICKLSDLNKLRLCILVMNAPPYKKQYTFLPKAENVGPCKRTTIDLSRIDVTAHGFMIQCLATSVDNPSLTVPIYISRNYKNEEVDTYTDLKGYKAVKLDHGFKNIFFVYEPNAKEIQARFEKYYDKDTTGGSGDGHASSVGSEGYQGSSSDGFAAAIASAVVAMNALDSGGGTFDGHGGDGYGDGGFGGGHGYGGYGGDGGGDGK